MTKHTLKHTIEAAQAAVPECMKVKVAELVAKAWENGRVTGAHEQNCRPYARDSKAFGHPADDYDSGL